MAAIPTCRVRVVHLLLLLVPLLTAGAGDKLLDPSSHTVGFGPMHRHVGMLKKLNQNVSPGPSVPVFKFCPGAA